MLVMSEILQISVDERSAPVMSQTRDLEDEEEVGSDIQAREYLYGGF